MPRIYDYIPNANVATLLLLLRADMNTRAFSGGTLAAKATGDPDAKTTTTINLTINGKLYIVAATATIDLSGTTAGLAATAGPGVQAAGKYAAYLITHNGSSFGCLKGADAATAAAALALLPAPATGTCPVGYISVANTTNPFVIGTTNSNATGVTWTCSDLSQVVNGPGTWYADTP